MKLKDPLEWRGRLPLDFGREAALARGRRGFAMPGLPCRRRLLWLAAGLLLIGLTSSAFGQTEPVKGEATFSAVGRLCPAGDQARRGCRIPGVDRRLHPRDPLQAPGGYSSRQTVRRSARLCRLGAARPRRLGDPAVAGAQGDHQHHDGGRAGVRRSVARQLERSAAGLPPKWSANCPSARGPPSAPCASSARPTRPRSARRSGSAPRCSRPSSASCSKCPTASASPAC